jgi:hypothetical protein
VEPQSPLLHPQGRETFPRAAISEGARVTLRWWPARAGLTVLFLAGAAWFVALASYSGSVALGFTPAHGSANALAAVLLTPAVAACAWPLLGRLLRPASRARRRRALDQDRNRSRGGADLCLSCHCDQPGTMAGGGCACLGHRPRVRRRLPALATGQAAGPRACWASAAPALDRGAAPDEQRDTSSGGTSALRRRSGLARGRQALPATPTGSRPTRHP